ncbi:hypothetical protein [Verrucomicrobium spinosum]|uniref:hypothetical protein n=1 Tax=Verrucomicrobium spinosum TaxID=2736 RepID=UPI0001744C65|nr:hypothetical protein [Verrucomicrobium spinosum]
MPTLTNIRHETFALRVAAGAMAAAAYRELYPRCSVAVSSGSASELLSTPKVAARVKEIREEMAQRMQAEAYLSLHEKRRMLADIARVNVVTLMDEKGALDIAKVRQLPPWCMQELTITENERTDKSGNTTTTRQIRVKMVDKLRAIKLDSDLEGTEKPPANTNARMGATKRARDLLKRLPGHGGHLIEATEVGQAAAR